MKSAPRSSEAAWAGPRLVPASEEPRVHARARAWSLPELVVVHSLSWLLVANLVGLWLATLLLAPRLGDLLAPLSYGRWMSVHMDLHLYGWCSLPLVGLLLVAYLGPEAGESARLARLALGLWSGSLAFGAVSWLAGESSGKLFLEWRGAARWVFAASQAVLAAVLLTGWLAELRRRRFRADAGLVLRGLLLLVLLPVPALLFWASSPGLYPPINPESGGATGTSLLGSVLGIVALLAGFPYLLGLRPTPVRAPAGPAGSGGLGVTGQTVVLLALHGLVFLVLGHSPLGRGDRSHHELAQLLALASTALWWPLLVRHLRRFPWPPASRRWLAACGGWAGLLLLSGLVTFLPGVLERWKFTNALVAHAHVAMAGLVSCLGMVILDVLLRSNPRARLLGGRGTFSAWTFFAWNGGCLLLVVALTVLGALEGASPGLVIRGGGAVTGLYLARWLGGALMVAASACWLWRGLEAR